LTFLLKFFIFWKKPKEVNMWKRFVIGLALLGLIAGCGPKKPTKEQLEELETKKKAVEVLQGEKKSLEEEIQKLTQEKEQLQEELKKLEQEKLELEEKLK